MGDFSANFRRPDTGINTVEGNVAGARAAQLEKKRLKEQEEFELRKQEIAARHATTTIAGKFATASATIVEQSFKDKTVGLVTAEQFKSLAAQEAKDKAKKKSFLDTTSDDEDAAKEPEAKKQKTLSKQEKKQKMREKKKLMSTLSFACEEEEMELMEAGKDDDDDDDNPFCSNTKSFKDPTVDTSFLPDKARDEERLRQKAKLEKEWKDQQQLIQKEKLEITYSYWDGSGHRRSVVVTKGDTIGDFLEVVRQSLAKDFRELGSVGSDALVYVKEDLIIPQDLSFYDLIATKARGKSGPLFHFDVRDDVRVGAIDTRVEKEESHPGKVVERRWCECQDDYTVFCLFYYLFMPMLECWTQTFCVFVFSDRRSQQAYFSSVSLGAL